MSEFTAINLAELTAPNIIEPLSFEEIFEAMRSDLVGKAPKLADLLDSDPAIKILQVAAYRELLLRARINDASQAVMLAFAQGSDLDHLSALFGVERQVIDAGDPNALPPRPPTFEDDARLRRRTQLSLEGHSTAGAIGSYIFHTLAASSEVKDVSVTSPSPGRVVVTVLSRSLLGEASPALVETVKDYLSAQERRPLTDQLSVQSAEILLYSVVAELTLFDGPDATLVLQTAERELQSFVTNQHRIGLDIAESGLYAALHQPGVQSVRLLEPASTLVINSEQAAFCDRINIQVVGRGQ